MEIRDEDKDLQAPEALIAALRELPREDIFIPPTVDEAVLRAARLHLARASKPPRIATFWLRLWASAGAALVTIGLLLLIVKPASHEPNELNVVREDINHDGRVDILDAFALARQVERAALPDSRLDINGDGKVNEQDAAVIARHAVRLEKGGRS